MKLLAFSTSLRDGSFNHKLIELAARIARRDGAEVDLADFHEFDMPLYDADMNREEGLPHGALALERRILNADALLIATPEYNYSMSGVFKNAIDWVSRARPMPWRGKAIYLMSASPSAMGGIRGLWQTRVPLEGCGALVFPDMFALPHSDKAFDQDGNLADRENAKRLEVELLGFIRMAEALAPICAKRLTGTARQKQREIVAALEEESKIQPAS
ncbi:NADPH-dependent FMN reductase [Labilithrix luteola]|uniref:NADPH-dependent FMN reductase n=1 Tax=Labilithrix luteola TaxID=1391654 RepID=A0A0K1PZ70_9BACT|nr:NAD(P)H-dependent oxidoreductase [Labilithrix luteola]AKU98825.1 NADPH-dependent FMN reductase [Labilithrix luteola]